MDPRAGAPGCILITGASSGIGRALAAHFAAPGCRLLLIARDGARLRETASLCRSQGAEVVCESIDVRDGERLASWIGEQDRARAIDLLIANAGVMAGVPHGASLESARDSRIVIETNLGGVLNTVQPMLPLMVARRSGQIAVVSSIGGFIPLPDAPSYGAAKAALISYGLALRGRLAEAGVRVNVIAPGYVTTAMTAQETGWKPFEMTAEEAARRIARGLVADRPIISFPWLFSALTRIGGLLPERLRAMTQRAFRFHVGDKDDNPRG